MRVTSAARRRPLQPAGPSSAERTRTRSLPGLVSAPGPAVWRTPRAEPLEPQASGRPDSTQALPLLRARPPPGSSSGRQAPALPARHACCPQARRAPARAKGQRLTCFSLLIRQTRHRRGQSPHHSDSRGSPLPACHVHSSRHHTDATTSRRSGSRAKPRPRAQYLQ